MKEKISFGERVFQIFNYIFLSLLVLIAFYPFWHTIMASFSDNQKLAAHSGVLLRPVGLSSKAYALVFRNKNIWTGYLNSLFLLVVGVPLSLLLTSIGAYLVSRKDLMLKKVYLIFFMLTMYFSGGIIPFYLTLVDLKMTGKLIGLIIPFCMSTWNLMILKTQFEGIPQDLCDAARIDGAGHLRILMKVVVPLSKASLAVIALYYGLGYWNAWFWASVTIRDPSKQPLQVILRGMIIEDVVNAHTKVVSPESIKYSTMVVSIIPIVCIYPFIQKHFKEGVLIGSVKG